MSNSTAHLSSWFEATKGEMPLPLTGPSLTISPLPSPYPQTIFLFGGKHVHSRRLTNDVWAMDLATKAWEKLDAGEGPCPRYFHSMDTWEDKLVCFGGMSESDPLCVHNDVWFFDCRTRKWLPQLSIPSGVSNSVVQDPSLLPLPRYAHLSAISRGQLVISGGQHSDNSWIYEINVYDLKHRIWVSKTIQPELNGQHSKGAYRSVAGSSKQRVIFPKGGLSSYSIEEEGEGGDVWCYSNYDFAKVRRELEVISPSDTTSAPANSRQFRSPPNLTIHDETGKMHGPSQPPGLRFPTGGIVGNHFILCGLYLASSSAAFSIWALDLTTLAWRHLEPAVLSTGSWNRAVIWPERAKLVVFGNSQSDLASDYGRRAVNLDHVALVNLETFGIYRPPRLEVPTKVQEIGLTMLDEKAASDFDVICDDGRKVKCSRKILSERWAWFAQQERSLEAKVAGVFREAPALDINDTLLGSFTPAQLTPAQLNLPEPFPVCVALVQYFYTLSLSTPLQNRAPILSALLFLAKQYKIERLRDLVVHALHCRLEPSIASGIYEIATLSGEQELQVRALNMIHTARGGSSSRSQQRRMSGSANNEGPPSTSPPAAPGSGAPGGSGNHLGMPSRNGSQDYGQHRQTRESTMLPLDDYERDQGQIKDLLNALSVLSQEMDGTSLSDVPRPESPIDPNQPTGDRLQLPPFQSRSALPRPTGIINPGDIDFTQNPSSPTVSEVSSFPQTPGSSRDYGHSDDRSPAFLDTRSNSGNSHFSGLATLPETQEFDPKTITRSFSTRNPGHLGINDVPTKKSVRPSTAPQASRPPLEPMRMSSMASMATTTTTSSDASSIYPATPASESRHSSSAALSFSSGVTIEPWPKPSDGASISSGSTGQSGRKLSKEEKKAQEAAEKASKKAAAQAEFEARRREQIRKIALDRAEAMKLAEIMAQPKVPKPSPPKGKFGKFAAKFGDNVLFPKGGENSMF